MKTSTTRRLLAAAALSVLLAGCAGKNDVPPAPDPAPPAETAQDQTPAPQEPEVQEPEAQEPASPEPEAPPAAPEAPPAQEPAPVLPEEDGGADAIADSYVGVWRDAPRGTSGGRCFMEIACGDGENYSIDIWWGSSAAETTHWQYTGTYDETWEGIDYIGTRYREVTQADSTVERTAELEEATGLLYLEDGVLLWEDTFEHQGEGMQFHREG